MNQLQSNINLENIFDQSPEFYESLRKNEIVNDTSNNTQEFQSLPIISDMFGFNFGDRDANPEHISQHQLLLLTSEGLQTCKKESNSFVFASDPIDSTSVGIELDARHLFVLSFDHKTVSIYRNNLGDLVLYHRVELIEPKYLWISSTCRYLCVVNKSDRDFELHVYDLPSKQEVVYIF